MIHLLILAAAALHLQDPAGDAVGNGSLSPPTAPVYANTAAFDLQSVTLTSAKDLTVRVTLGALPDPGKLPNGFSSAIVEVYLDTAPGGSQQLLPGSGMTMPPKHGWEVALRATGDAAYAVEAQKAGSPATWPRLPVKVAVSGTTIVLSTSLPRPEHATLYALTGVYDPFTKDGWRPLSASPSPWAFSSSTQHVPVVDVLAPAQAAQRHEIDSGVLAPYRSRTYGIGWLFLMLAGVVLAAAGAFLRRRAAPRKAVPGGRVAAAPDPQPLSEGDSGVATVAIEERFLDDAEEAELWPDAEESVDRASVPGAGVAASVEPAGDLAAATANGAEALDEPTTGVNETGEAAGAVDGAANGTDELPDGVAEPAEAHGPDRASPSPREGTEGSVPVADEATVPLSPGADAVRSAGEAVTTPDPTDEADEEDERPA